MLWVFNGSELFIQFIIVYDAEGRERQECTGIDMCNFHIRVTHHNTVLCCISFVLLTILLQTNSNGTIFINLKLLNSNSFIILQKLILSADFTQLSFCTLSLKFVAINDLFYCFLIDNRTFNNDLEVATHHCDHKAFENFCDNIALPPFGIIEADDIDIGAEIIFVTRKVFI